MTLLPPGAPGITATTALDGALDVALSPASGALATSYAVTCSSGIDSKSVSGTATTLRLSGLDNGIPWVCAATATNAAGTSAPGTAATGTPNPVLPVAAALPVMRIATSGGAAITSTETYVPATLTITDTDGTVLTSTTTEIRGRGHSTWNYPKKPFRLKLTSKASLLGMPSNRHWVLLANYVDRTLVRTEAIFDLAERMGFAWTPRSRPVVVELNGTYQGVYQLVEHIRIDPNRVAIDELKAGDTAAPAVTGGYLIEIDERKGEDYCPESARTSVTFCFANPETLLDPAWSAQKAYIDQYLADTEAALYGADFANPTTGYAAYIDVASAVDWYLVNEFVKNVDSNFFSSVFLYKPRGGKLVFGPVWDFDLAMGNANFFGAADSTGYRTRSAQWYARLFEDPAFAARVASRWRTLRANGTINAIFATMDRRAAFYSQVQVQNFQAWPVLNTQIPLIRPVTGTYAQHVAETKRWLLARRDWLDQQFR